MESRGRIRLKTKEKSAKQSNKFQFLGIFARHDLWDLSPSFLLLQVPMRTKYSEALSTGEPPTQSDRDDKNFWELSRSESMANHSGSEMGTAGTLCL